MFSSWWFILEYEGLRSWVWVLIDLFFFWYWGSKEWNVKETQCVSQIRWLRLIDAWFVVLRLWVRILIELGFESYKTLKFEMKSAQRRCASARRIVSAVGRSLVCGHHRGACAGSSPAWSWSRGCFAEMSAGGYGKMNHQQLEFYWSVRMWQRFKEVVSHHSSLWVNPGWASWVLPITLPYFSFQSIFVNFINRMTRSRLSRSKLDYFIYRATFPPWAAPGDRREKKKTQDQGCSANKKHNVNKSLNVHLNCETFEYNTHHV